MKGLHLIRRLFPEAKHSPCFGLDYEIAQHPGWPFESPDAIVMVGDLSSPGFRMRVCVEEKETK